MDKDLFKTWLQGIVPCKDIQIAHETGEEGYQHTHVVIHTIARYSTRDPDLRDFDFNEIHPNIKILKGQKAYKDALGYISKEDKTVRSQPLSLCDQVWACESLEEALDKFVVRPSCTPGIIALFNARPKGPIWKPIETRGWQTLFYDMIKESYCERSVYWLRSRGNSGKTFFMKYMMQQHPTDCLLIADAYMSRDISLMFKNAVDQNNTCKYVLVDCSRAFNFPDQFYTILERIKDGLMTSTKYCSSTVMFQNAVLVVMSNQWPNITKLSYDRWKTYDIVDQDLIPIDTNDVLKDHISSDESDNQYIPWNPYVSTSTSDDSNVG